MTPRQQLKSIEKKMQRIKDKVPNIEDMIKYGAYINDYDALRFEHFKIKWSLENCEKCGQKL
jgi:hypothetical protein